MLLNPHIIKTLAIPYVTIWGPKQITLIPNLHDCTNITLHAIRFFPAEDPLYRNSSTPAVAYLPCINGYLTFFYLSGLIGLSISGFHISYHQETLSISVFSYSHIRHKTVQSREHMPLRISWFAAPVCPYENHWLILKHMQSCNLNGSLATHFQLRSGRPLLILAASEILQSWRLPGCAQLWSYKSSSKVRWNSFEYFSAEGQTKLSSLQNPDPTLYKP